MRLVATAHKSGRVLLYQLAQGAAGQGTAVDDTLAGAVVDNVPAITGVCCICIFGRILFLQQVAAAAPWLRLL